MINLVERRLVTIKPKEAAQMIAEHNAYSGQRPLRDAHVRYLSGKMEENRFFQEAQIAFARLPDGSSTILNGQHSLRSCVRSGVPIDASIRVFECRDETDLFQLYSEMDQGLRRSQADVTRAGRNIMPPSLQSVHIGQLAQYGAAILMAPAEGRPAVFQSRSISPQNRVTAVCANPEEALFLHRYFGWMLLNRVAVRMAMAATFRADADRARLFWDGVVHPDQFPNVDPRKQLFNRLLEKECARSSAFAVHRTYSACLNHWNAHAAGKAVVEDNDRTPEAMKPTVPVPLLATVKLPPRPENPTTQTFTAAMPSLSALPAAAQ